MGWWTTCRMLSYRYGACVFSFQKAWCYLPQAIEQNTDDGQGAHLKFIRVLSRPCIRDLLPTLVSGDESGGHVSGHYYPHTLSDASAVYNSHEVASSNWLPFDKAEKKCWPWVQLKQRGIPCESTKERGKCILARCFLTRARQMYREIK